MPFRLLLVMLVAHLMWGVAVSAVELVTGVHLSDPLDLWGEFAAVTWVGVRFMRWTVESAHPAR